jgi:hypothetical protein
VQIRILKRKMNMTVKMKEEEEKKEKTTRKKRPRNTAINYVISIPVLSRKSSVLNTESFMTCV